VSATQPSVGPLAASEYAEAGRLLARAYLHDPQFVYVLPDEGERQRRSPWFFSAVLRYSAAVGTLLAAEGGVAILIPPGGHTPSLTRMLRSGLIAAPLRLGPGALSRLTTFAAASRDLRAGVVQGPFWYVGGIGVDPERQGEGIGTALMDELGDRAGDPLCLETASERNIAWYERLGYAVIAEGRVPNGPAIWSMKRRDHLGSRA
jgi:ribosomal protein S18 acetylase RimI-like enzyme